MFSADYRWYLFLWYRRPLLLISFSRSSVQGAEGVGLIRTEHMFFEKVRLDLFRQMILSTTVEERCACLTKMLPLQQQDFREIFRLMPNRLQFWYLIEVIQAMKGLLPLLRQVTVRLLDPPLHEFLPKKSQADSTLIAYEEELQELSAKLGISLDICKVGQCN